MNIYELIAMINSLKNEKTTYDNSELIAFYERKKIDMLVAINEKITIGLKEI